jgi:hypothetical protein
MSEWVLKTPQKFEDFQAEYEGSIPFTRSTAPSGQGRYSWRPTALRASLVQDAMSGEAQP